MLPFSVLSLVLAFGIYPFGQHASHLAINISHSGNFLAGQTNAFYLIRVSNAGKADSSGLVQVADYALYGFKITSLSGEGWFCSPAACWREDGLTAGRSYPAIVALATVDPIAPPSVPYKATLTHNGDLVGTAEDVATVEAQGVPVAWGWNYWGLGSMPLGLKNIVAAGGDAYHTVALKSDGTVAAWGWDYWGGVTVPAGLKNVVAVAAGWGFDLALKSDGTVVAWGRDAQGGTDVPAGLKHVVAIAANWGHCLALKSDGTVVAWGSNDYHEREVPADLRHVVAIAAGSFHSLALKDDGTVVAWGSNGNMQTYVPWNLASVVAIAAGNAHSLALKSDGTVVGWGYDLDGEVEIPPGLTDVIAIAGGADHSMALKKDGTVVAWGDDSESESDVPAGLSHVVFGISAGSGRSLALTSPAPHLTPIAFTTFPTCETYTVDAKKYQCGVLFDWVPGDKHTIATTAFQVANWWNGTGLVEAAHFTFTGWSDGGAISHTIKTPATATTYTANFHTQFLLLTSVSPAGGGTIQPATGPTGVWLDALTPVIVTATPNPGYQFAGWSGDCVGSGACQLTMDSPHFVTANFAPGP